MSVYFNPNTGGIPGQSGTMSAQTQVFLNRKSKDELWLGAPSSPLGYGVTQGYNMDRFLNNVEKDMGYNDGSLSWARSVTSNYDTNNVLFQDVRGNYVDLDFSNSTYKIKSEKNIMNEAGINTADYDKLTFDQGGFSFYKFYNTGLNDGSKDYTGFFRQRMDNLKWGLTSVILAEISSDDDIYNF